MKLYELMELIPDGQRVALMDAEYRSAGEYDGKNSIDSVMNDMDVFSITAEDGTINIMCEVPTKTVRFEATATYTASIEVEVPITASDSEIVDILDDKASDIGCNLPCNIDVWVYNEGSYDFELDDTEFETNYYEEV